MPSGSVPPSDLIDLLRIVGPIPLRLAHAVAGARHVDVIEVAGFVVVSEDGGQPMVSLAVEAATTEVPPARRRSLLGRLARASEDEPLEGVHPSLAVAIGEALVAEGSRAQTPLVRALRASLLLGQIEQAILFAGRCRALFPQDVDVAHLVAMAYETLGRHGSAAAVSATATQDPAWLGRWRSNLFVSMRGDPEGVLEPPMGATDGADPHREMLASQAWIDILDGNVSATSRTTAIILNDPAASAQAIVWACVAGAVGAALDARGRIAHRLVAHGREVASAHGEGLSPFATLQLDLADVLVDIRLGDLASASTRVAARVADAPSAFLAATWRAMGGLALRERGEFEAAADAFRTGLSSFVGDNFGLITWARSEEAVCRAMLGLPAVHDLVAEPFGLYEACIERNRAWVHAANGELPNALDAIERAIASAFERGQNAHAILAITDLARFGRARRAATMLASVTEHDAPVVQLGALAVVAFSEGRLGSVVDAWRAAAEVGVEPLTSELASLARSRAARHDLGTLARVELWTNPIPARTPRAEVPRPLDALTPREWHVGRLAASGWSTKAISEQEGRSTRTIDNLLGRVYAKCAVEGRAELATQQLD